jgi:hypothetical protein
MGSSIRGAGDGKLGCSKPSEEPGRAFPYKFQALRRRVVVKSLCAVGRAISGRFTPTTRSANFIVATHDLFCCPAAQSADTPTLAIALYVPQEAVRHRDR